MKFSMQIHQVEVPGPDGTLRECDAPAPESREVYWRDLGGFHATDIFPGSALGAGFEFEGPVILDLPDTTVVVPPGASGRVDKLGSIVIDVGQPPGEGATATAAAAAAQS